MKATPWIIVLIAAGSAFATITTVGRFSTSGMSGWEEKTLLGKKKSVYTLVREGEHNVLKAESHGSASGLIYRIKFDSRQNPILRWSWKVSGTMKKGDEQSRAGDDYPARVYVVFPRTFFWQTRAINYIWANRLAKGASVPNVFAPKNIRMVAVESGQANVGRWVAEERNIHDDYVKLFGEEPPRAGAIAIMTDTDNTGEDAVAWYGDITLSAK